jgi:hypothetical protein
VAARVREAFEPLFHWDNFGEQRRLQIVQEHDYKNDPAMSPVRAHYWNLVALIHNIENEIRNWELMPVPVPSEALIREQRLSALRGELAAREAQSNASYAVPPAANTAIPGSQALPLEPASDDVAKPWLVADLRDPKHAQSWYISARYFARQLVIEDPTLATKKLILAGKVSHSLFNVGVKKRGNKEKLAAETILKAFSKVSLG